MSVALDVERDLLRVLCLSFYLPGFTGLERGTSTAAGLTNNLCIDHF
jgi:hypothetical protein